MTNRRHTGGRRPRRGLTLVELIVAMTIMSVGLLAVVGASSKIAAELGASRQSTLAGMYAQSRFEELAGTACASIAQGTVRENNMRTITERWIVTDGGNNTLSVIDTVSWTNGRSVRRQVFRSLLVCRPGA